MQVIKDIPDHVYVNVNCTNFAVGGNGLRPAKFSENRSGSIVDRPNEYYFSIVRAQICTELLPLMICPVEIGQADPLRTIYSVTLKTATNTVTRNVRWSPQFADAPTPAGPLVSQNKSTLFYYLMDFTHMMRLFNTTLEAATTELNTLEPALGLLKPYLTYDGANSLFTLHVDSALMNSGSTPTVNLYLNEEAYSLFPSFEAIKSSLGYQMMCWTDPLNSNIADNYLSQKQQYANLQGFLGFNTIIISSSLLGARNEFMSPARTDAASSNATFPVLTDIGVQADTGFEIKTGAAYVPSAEYRLIDCAGSSSISSLDFQIYWSDKTGEVQPLYMPPRGSFNIKCLFRKKSLGA
jgi:hypothetical protein